MQPFDISPEVIVGIASALLSLVFTYAVGLNTKYAALPSETKSLIMGGIILAVTVGVFALNCFSIIVTQVTCDNKGAIELAWMFVIAIMSNQGVYTITKSLQPSAVKKAIEVRDAKLTLEEKAATM